MLVVERPCRAELLLLLVLALAPPATLAQAQEPVVVRLRDAVGDTIDLAERDSFRLFPNTAGFQRAVILALPGPDYFAKVARIDGDSLFPVYYRILPGQLERIRFLIDYRQFVAQQQKSDLNAVRSLTSFWQTVEGKPLRSIAVARAEPVPADTPYEPRVAGEDRYHAALLGAAAGSALGGCAGSWAGIDVVDQVPTTNCLDQSIMANVYSVNHPLYWTTACGLTALGTAAGYMYGDRLIGTKAAPLPPLPDEDRGWRIGCATGGAAAGLILGTGYFLLTGPLHYGRTEPLGRVDNDRSFMTTLPMALTGLCITVEATTIGFFIGRSIDRQNAEKAEKKRRELGR